MIPLHEVDPWLSATISILYTPRLLCTEESLTNRKDILETSKTIYCVALYKINNFHTTP